MLICPYCFKPLSDLQTMCCGELGHGVEASIEQEQPVAQEREKVFAEIDLLCGTFLSPNSAHTREYARACADLQDAIRALKHKTAAIPAAQIIPEGSSVESIEQAAQVEREVPEGLLNALRCQRQIDEDGTEVGVSRQAVDEAIEILAAIRGGEK